MDSADFQQLWQKAASFAARQHQGQLRKDGQTPYFAHPVRVALTVRHVFGVNEETALVAALLHDLIEDTTTDYDDLIGMFGKQVADAVAALTKDSRLPEDEREAAYDRQLAAASWQARLVKLADVYDNFCDARHDHERQKCAVKAERAIRCAGDVPELQPAIGILRQLVTGHDQPQATNGTAQSADRAGSATQLKTQVIIIEPDWVIVSFQGPRPPADKRAFFLHRTIQDWLAQHPGLAIRRTLAIQDAGELIGVHVWLGDRSQTEQRPFAVKLHYRLVDQVPQEHLEALLAHAYEIFFEHRGSQAGALAVISRSGRAVVFDRRSEQCFVLPLDEMGNLDDHAAKAIADWQTQQSTNYFVMELGGFEATQ